MPQKECGPVVTPGKAAVPKERQCLKQAPKKLLTPPFLPQIFFPHLIVHGKLSVKNVLEIGLHLLQLRLQPAQRRQLVLDLVNKRQHQKK